MTDYLQHPDWLALLRGILEEPAADLPRLVAADWLDENGHGDRAEYIRAECRIGELEREFLRANPFDYVGEKLDGYNREFTATFFALRTLGSHRPGTPQGCVESTSTGGFVGRVMLTQAAFLGGPCDRCEGQGCTFCGGEERDYHTKCNECVCHGTGRTPGLAAALFAAHPITAVTLTGYVPYEGVKCMAAWLLMDENQNNRYHIVAELFRLLDGHLFGVGSNYGARWYTSDAEAHAALSRAAVAHGRALAGLPQLPASVAASV